VLVGEAEVAAQDVARRLVVGVVQERRQSTKQNLTIRNLELVECQMLTTLNNSAAI
jgi:hypothetical protein